MKKHSGMGGGDRQEGGYTSCLIALVMSRGQGKKLPDSHLFDFSCEHLSNNIEISIMHFSLTLTGEFVVLGGRAPTPQSLAVQASLWREMSGQLLLNLPPFPMPQGD